jgi:hypothetical protein
MGRKTYWRALDVKTTLIVSKALAGTGITSQYASKDSRTELLILFIVALLYRNPAPFPNDIRDNVPQRFPRDKTRTYSEARYMPSAMTALSGRNFSDVIL